MVLGGRLKRYFAFKFLGAALAVFGGVFVLVVLLDYIELMRRSADIPNVSALLVAKTSLYRVPQVTERIMPFCILVGAMVCFLGLSRRLELVIARSVGMSAWQFVLPAILTALIFGIVATAIYNPLSAIMQEKAKKLEAQIFGTQQPSTFGSVGGGFWVRQKTNDGETIINAKSSEQQGALLGGVTIFVYDKTVHFVERIEANAATLGDQKWVLSDAKVYKTGQRVEEHKTFDVPTNLNPEQVRESFATPETVPFWRLPAFIKLAEDAGLRGSGYRLQYEKLLAQPFLLASMVLLAAAVSLRFVRFGGVQKMVVIGVLMGFFIFVMAKVVDDLSKAGAMSPFIAAWLPVSFGSVVGFMTILFQEDG
jgi:lipopolysaccharide export system permease protein